MGDTDEDGPDRIDLADCAKLLGWSLPLLWCLSKVGEFASPAGTKDGQPVWNENDVFRWAASTHPELINRVPSRYWPDANRPAAYLGAREIEAAVVQSWGTDVGTVCVLWSRRGWPGCRCQASLRSFRTPIL